MKTVRFPMITATCDKGHVTEIPYTPNAVEKTGGCDCYRDSSGSLTYDCYCTPERNVFTWWCPECSPVARHSIEID